MIKVKINIMRSDYPKFKKLVNQQPCEHAAQGFFLWLHQRVEPHQSQQHLP